MTTPRNSYFLDHISHCFTSPKPLMRALAYDCVNDLVTAMTSDAKVGVKKEWEAYYNHHPEYKALVLGADAEGAGTTKRLEVSYKKLDRGIAREKPRMAERIEYLKTNTPSMKLYNEAK